MCVCFVLFQVYVGTSIQYEGLINSTMHFNPNSLKSDCFGKFVMGIVVKKLGTED